MTPDGIAASVLKAPWFAIGAARRLCVLNRCGRPQGVGTWCQVVGLDGSQPVCEEHWKAVRDIFPVEVPSD